MSFHTLHLDEGQRQMVLLALATLSIQRPGWDDALNRIAAAVDNKTPEGRAVMYDEFRGARHPGNDKANRKPPVFVALMLKGDVCGYVRADQIESILVGGQRPTQIRTMSGYNCYTDETRDQVFAKMADALNTRTTG